MLISNQAQVMLITGRLEKLSSRVVLGCDYYSSLGHQ